MQCKVRGYDVCRLHVCSVRLGGMMCVGCMCAV